MSNFPDDANDTGLAYVAANASSPYGKLRLVIRLPELRRQYPLDAVELNLNAQYGGSKPSGPEPSYGWHLTATSFSDGLEVNNLDRTSKAMKKLNKKLESIERSTGPAVLLSTYVTRLIFVSGVKYVYIDHEIDSRRSIPDMLMWVPERDGMTLIHDGVSMLCSALAKRFPAD